MEKYKFSFFEGYLWRLLLVKNELFFIPIILSLSWYNYPFLLLSWEDHWISIKWKWVRLEMSFLFSPFNLRVQKYLWKIKKIFWLLSHSGGMLVTRSRFQGADSSWHSFPFSSSWASTPGRDRDWPRNSKPRAERHHWAFWAIQSICRVHSHLQLYEST